MSTALWTSRDAEKATGGRSTKAWDARGVSIDSRTVQPGDLFIALKDQRDGHAFVTGALAAGAAAAMVEYVPEGVADDAPLLIVEDTFAALEALGRAGRARMSGQVVAVTGSVGKTSTKEMLRSVLSRQGLTHASVASYNNHWGVPLTLARMPQSTEFAVIEIGMNAPGEILPLAQMARPHVALVTTVAAAHLEAFGSVAAIAREKGSIYQALEPGGVAVVNEGIDTGHILYSCGENARRIVGFGDEDAYAHAKSVRIHDDCTAVEARVGALDVMFKIAAPGRHFAENTIGVMATIDALGADVGRAAMDMHLWEPPAGRGQKMRLLLDAVDETSGLDLIDDAYDANPTSMRAALEVLAAASPIDDIGRVSKGRRIAILGDMLELGSGEAQLHAELAAEPHLKDVTQVHCVGPRMQALWDALPHHQRGCAAADPDALIADLPGLLDAGDVVLVKGSKGSQVWRVVEAIKKMGQVLST